MSKSKAQKLTPFERGLIAVALIKVREQMPDNKHVNDAIKSISRKLGISISVAEGSLGWSEFRSALETDLGISEGGAV